MIISINDNDRNITNYNIFEANDQSKYYNRDNIPEQEIDYIILIQSGKAHFDLLTLLNSTLLERKKLYDFFKKIVNDKLGY